MAGVKSLVVRGIRSFGPDDPDEQGITFESPLTLILGQNGCGKTTIIECLRYAITGQMPPGSHNDCFVHDAKVNKSTEVLGQVKLKFINAKDKPMEVIRSMRVQLLKKKSKFSTVDSLLATTNENGERKEISMKCAELDSIIQDQLGVSKAILNSVIFCHQEDSSWPLDEGKKVKERFDEIFDSDKYSTCFDRLKKIRKGYATDIKVLETQVSFLTEQKKDLDKKKLDVVNTETRIGETELKLSEIAKDLKPVEEKLQTIKILEKNLEINESKLEKIKMKIEHNKTREDVIKRDIKNPMEGTLPELREKLTNYETTAVTKKKELEESYKKITMFNKDEEKIANEHDTNKMKLQKYDVLESQNEKKILKRNELVLDAAKIADISDITKVENKEEAEKAMKAISDKIKILKQELNELKTQCDAEEKQKQALVDESRDALTRHKQQTTNKEKDIQKNKDECIRLDKGIVAANESKLRLEAAEAKFKNAEEQYELVEKEVNTEELQQQINEDEKEFEKYETELDEIDNKVKILQKLSAKLKERDLVQESLTQKEKQLTTLKNKHRSALTELLGSMPEKDFTISLKKLEYSLNGEVNSIKKDLKKKQTEITTLDAERKHVRETLNERRSELTKAEDQMYQACSTQSYEATLTKINATVKELQDDHSDLQASMFLISKYEKQLKENSCCPLCNRGFEQETEVIDLISQLNNKVLTVPSQLEKVSEELQKASAKKDELLSMKSLNEKIISLKEKDIPQLEERLADIDNKIKTLTEFVEGLTMSLVEPEQKQATAKQIHGDMPMLDRYIQEIAAVTKNLDKIKAQCPEMESDMTLDEANAKQTELKQTVNTLKNKIKDATKKRDAHNKKLQKLGEQKNKLKEECLNLQKKVQEICNLQEKKKQLETDRETFLLELNELKGSIEPLKLQLKEKEDDKAELVKKNRAIVDTKNTYIMEVINAFNKVKSIESEIKQHEDKNIPQEKIKTEEAIKKCEEKLKQIVVDRQAITKRIEILKDEISKHDINKRELEGNIKLRDIQSELAEFDKEEADVKQKLSEIDRDAIKEKVSLLAQYKSLNNEQSTTNGVLSELKNTLKKNKADLKTALNKDTERKYREKFYELHVTKLLDKDIKDYSVTLEKCLLEFHKKKMESINLIIRDLWGKIYSGNDIDYIAIKAEGSTTTDSERRKYEYRVVQCKNGVEIDMRGRCSAGQKVLACLIIRLALAETFSSRFGILALDEPTTNLDEENIKSLCAALAEIVQDRMSQKNFMFIIITHDREFIESLGQVDKVTHYYEVSRNDDGKSRIKRVRFS